MYMMRVTLSVAIVAMVNSTAIPHVNSSSSDVCPLPANHTSDAGKVPVIVLATASPCKFEESVTAAVGRTEWERYATNDFPVSGKTILQRPEVAPEMYKAEEDLVTSHVLWEKKARHIVEELLGAS